MAHDIANVNGKSSVFSVGQLPWHGLGKNFDESTWLTPTEALDEAGCNFEVDTFPLLSTEVKNANGDVVIPAGQPMKTQGVYRKDNNVILGEVGPNTHLFQNVDAFNFFAEFVEQRSVKFECAGALGKGERVWVLARIVGGTKEIVKNDPVERFLLLSNSHDGTMAVRVGFTPIRVVCANTLAMAHRNSASKLIRIRHHAGVKEAVNDVKNMINVANKEFEATFEQYLALAKKKIAHKADLIKYVKIVLSGEDTPEKDLSAKMKNQIVEVCNLVFKGQGNNLPGVAGSWWAAYNGVTEYFNYENGRNVSSRLNSLWFGTNAMRSVKALETAIQMAA